MKAYASRTGTRRNLSALREAGWGLFISAAGCHRDEGFRFIIDNGAWSSYQLGEPWTPERFEKLLASHGRHDRCEGIVAPDVVCGGTAPLRLSLDWLGRLLEYGPRVYLPVQPGITAPMIRAYLDAHVGVFVGGDTAWKEATAALWARVAHDRGAACHVGRVNSLRRLMICKAAGADSFDGSGPSRYEKHLHEMQAARGVMVQLGLEVTMTVTCFYGLPQSGLGRDFGEFEVRIGVSIDVILLMAAEAGLDLVTEVQSDEGIWERDQSAWVFKTWTDLAGEEVANAEVYDSLAAMA